MLPSYCLFFFFFNDTATTEIYTLSLHDALPIYTNHEVMDRVPDRERVPLGRPINNVSVYEGHPLDRKSTRLNSSHSQISYAVFCLKKKKTTYKVYTRCRTGPFVRRWVNDNQGVN